MREKERAFLEQVSSGIYSIDPMAGTIFSRRWGKSVGRTLANGYLGIGIYYGAKRHSNVLNHRIVYMYVHGDIPNGMQINHIDGNKQNNRIDNLEVVTPSQNVRHARDVLGKKFGFDNIPAKGEDNGRALITWDDVREIRRLHSTREYSQRELCKRYAIKKSQMSNIVRGVQWIEEA